MAAIQKVLILDEIASNRLFFEVLFQELDQGYEVFSIATGAEAEAVAVAESVQFVISAWEMDVMPGTVFIQRLREHKTLRFIPVLLFTKNMTPEEITLTRELGFEHIVGMPFDRDDVQGMIEEILKAEENLSWIERALRKVEYLIEESQFQEALKVISPALSRQSDFKARAYFNYALIWVESQNLEKGEKAIEQALKIDPEHIPSRRLKARIHSLLGQHEESLAILTELAEQSPHNISSKLCLGAAYVEADQHEKASELFAQVESMDEENRSLADERGKLAFKEGQFDLAAQLLAETRRGDEIARNFNNMAIALVRTGRFEEGINAYQQAINLLGEKARLHQLHFNMGLAWRKKGELEKSFVSFCSSYLADPSFERAYGAVAKTARELKDAGKTLDEDWVDRVKACREINPPPPREAAG